METIKSSKCEVVGSVLNRAFTPTWRRRFAHFAALAVILTRMVSSFAAEQPATQSLSVSSPEKLAEWQKRFTLGPGDTFDVKLHDTPDQPVRITVGPDGRINFLEAQDVMASGLTVDELRARLDEVLGKFHRSAKTVIIPAAYNSKRYFILGNVTRRGTFPLDRPISLVEAVARASGFVNREGIILADLSRSFLVRKNSDASFAPVTVDLEALFLRGDLTQNQAMAPDDYLYFMPSDMPEVYILGEVPGPGNLPYAANLSVLRAIAGRGGFLPKAFRSRVLVVRGSLSQPETFVVNTADILAGRAPDFKLEPRDIVYVSRRPWALAEELLEAAVTDFMRAVLVSWTGANIGPFIKKPVF